MVHLQEVHGALEALFGARIFKLIRYVTSGGTAALTNMAMLFLLVRFGGIYYLYASIIAFAVSVGVSFTMQKFWTFQDTPLHDVHAQFARCLVVILSNLALNTVLVYLFVEKIGVWYLYAQVFAAVIIAVVGYFAYRYFVFRDRPALLP